MIRGSSNLGLLLKLLVEDLPLIKRAMSSSSSLRDDTFEKDTRCQSRHTVGMMMMPRVQRQTKHLLRRYQADEILAPLREISNQRDRSALDEMR